MKFDPAKAYPHPVLRRFSTDYEAVEFEVTFDELERQAHTTAFTLCAEFQLSDPDLLRLVDSGHAQYALLTSCSRTRYRKLSSSFEPQVCVKTADGDVLGDVEITPFLVAVQEIRGFRAKHWNRAFRNLPAFHIEAGAVLAVDEPAEHPIDTAEEARINSIFDLTRDDELSLGEWRCDLSGDRINVALSLADYERFLAARERIGPSPESAYILNSIYLPSLLHALHQADRLTDALKHCRWFRTIDTKLSGLGCEPLGSPDADRLSDAQRIFESPFRHLPFLTSPESF